MKKKEDSIQLRLIKFMKFTVERCRTTHEHRKRKKRCENVKSQFLVDFDKRECKMRKKSQSKKHMCCVVYLLLLLLGPLDLALCILASAPAASNALTQSGLSH